MSLNGTILAIDIAGYSTTPRPEQYAMVRDLFNEIRQLLTAIYGANLHSPSDLRILPTGDGAIIALLCPASTFATTQETGIWLAASLLAWGKGSRCVPLRCGMSAGEILTVEDPCGNENLCGCPINDAERIMEAAHPGQLLVDPKSIADQIAADGLLRCNDVFYKIEPELHQIITKHRHLPFVQNVTGHIGDNQKEITFGISEAPDLRWYYQIDLPQTVKDDFGNDYKIPLAERLRDADRVAFIGATNDQLPDAFASALDMKPGKNWKRIIVCSLSDTGLTTPGFVSGMRATEELIQARNQAQENLLQTLSSRAHSLDIRQYDFPFFFASFWNWENPGGTIHVSPAIWNTDVRICPGLDYRWYTEKQPDAYARYAQAISNYHQWSRHLGAGFSS